MSLRREPSRFFFICLLTTLLLAVFYNTVTNMAGLYIASDLGGSSYISVYSMVFFGLGNILSIPLADPLADRLGPIKLLVHCLLLYAFFSFFCGIAPTFAVLILLRLGMGIASGPFYVLSRRLLFAFSPPEKIDGYSFAMVLILAIAPVLGASFGAWLGYENMWRLIFYINEPIPLFLAAYFWFFYRYNDPESSPFVPFDKVGYLFFSLSMSALITAATLSQQLDWYRSPTLVCLTVIGVPSLFFFIVWELLHPYPLLQLKLLRNLILSYSLFNLAVLFSIYFGMIILISLWLNIYVNYTPWWITAVVATMAFAGILAYFVIRHLIDRLDFRFTLGLAILCFASSCYYSTYFDVDVDFFHLVVARFFAGLGLVLFLLPIFQAIFSCDEPKKSPQIFVLMQVVRVLACCFGSGLYVILWQRRQVFFHERLGENLTINSQITLDYFQRATEVFHLTKEQSRAQLNVFLERQATSLALNDVFGCMGYILVGMFVLLLISFLIPNKGREKIKT